MRAGTSRKYKVVVEEWNVLRKEETRREGAETEERERESKDEERWNGKSKEKNVFRRVECRMTLHN